jgi:hypothetical protein
MAPSIHFLEQTSERPKNRLRKSTWATVALRFSMKKALRNRKKKTWKREVSTSTRLHSHTIVLRNHRMRISKAGYSFWVRCALGGGCMSMRRGVCESNRQSLATRKLPQLL